MIFGMSYVHPLHCIRKSTEFHHISSECQRTLIRFLINISHKLIPVAKRFSILYVYLFTPQYTLNRTPIAFGLFPGHNFINTKRFFQLDTQCTLQVSLVGKPRAIKEIWYQQKYMHHETSLLTNICIIWYLESKVLVLNAHTIE